MKKLLFASAFAAALALGLPMAAQADTKVKVYLGLDHYDYQVGPDYRFRDGYGWYRPVAVFKPWTHILWRSQKDCAQQRLQECRTRLNAMAAPIRSRPRAAAVMSPCS